MNLDDEGESEFLKKKFCESFAHQCGTGLLHLIFEFFHVSVVSTDMDEYIQRALAEARAYLENNDPGRALEVMALVINSTLGKDALGPLARQAVQSAR